ncbi:MAG: sugar transferase [Chloroflexi bacterium]|nr:sugar transferase [Chloroflexota bacterium]
MQAVIIATNEHSPLGPFTQRVPAAMLPIADRPIASFAVELLARNKLRNILMCLYQQGESVEAYFGAGHRWGVDIQYILQREFLGSAGAIKRAGPYLKDTFIVLPADAIIDLDVAAAVAQHRERQSAATLILRDCTPHTAPHTAAQGQPGYLAHVDQQGHVVAVRNRAVQNQPGDHQVDGGRALACTGAAIFDPRVLQFIPPKVVYDINEALLPTLLANQLPVDGFELDGYWNPIDSLAAYQAAQKMFLTSAWPLAIDALQIAPGVWIGKNHVIHPTARIAPPVYIGANCLIGRDVELGPYAMVGKNTIIDDEATITDSTVLPNTYVGRLVNIEHRVVDKHLIGDPNTSEVTEVVDEFLLAEARPQPLGGSLRRFCDGFAALLLLLVTVPLSMLAGVAAWMTSRGQLIRRVPCVTTAGATPGGAEDVRTFDLLRFQTRLEDGSYSLIGRWLERLEWDRFPELVNVIRGDLCLVGVKPLTREEAARVTEEWQKRRFEYPAGMTGLWYVRTAADRPEGSGRSKGSDSDLDDVLVADAYYAATRTWREDLRLFLQTPVAWLRHLQYRAPSAEFRVSGPGTRNLELGTQNSAQGARRGEDQV